MNTNDKLSKKQISEQIIAGMGMVYELFNEMHSFFRLLIESLDSSDLDIALLRSKFVLPHAKRRLLRNAADAYVRTDMGILAELGATTVEEDEVEEEQEESEDEFGGKGISIVPGSKFLSVRAVLYDPKRVIDKSFEPYVIAAVLSEITGTLRGKASKKAEGLPKKFKEFHINRRKDFFKIMSRVERGIEKDQEISCQITKYELTAKISGVESQLLVDFDTEERFDGFVQAIISMANATEKGK